MLLYLNRRWGKIDAAARGRSIGSRSSSSAMSSGLSFSASNDRPRPARKLSTSPLTVLESSMPCAVSTSIWAVKMAAVFFCCRAAVSPN